MKTTIEKTFSVNQSIDKVWGFLSDPTKVVTCVPGASITEVVDDRNYKGAVTLKFGPVKASYDGAIAIEELDHSNHKMVLKGSGMDTKGKGSADMTMNGLLSENGGVTDVNYSMEISVTGTLAQFGSRLINDVSDQLANQFISSFKGQLEAAPAAVAEEGSVDVSDSDAAAPEGDNAVNAFSILWGVIKSFFRRLFGGGKTD